MKEVGSAFALEIDVTQERINKGNRRDCQLCAIAIALCRAALDRFPEDTFTHWADYGALRLTFVDQDGSGNEHEFEADVPEKLLDLMTAVDDEDAENIKPVKATVSFYCVSE